MFEDGPIYTQNWEINFNLVTMKITKKAFWIRLINLPLEYWSVEYLKAIGVKIGRVVRCELEKNDSTLFACIKILSIRAIPSQIILKTKVGIWVQDVETKEPSFF